MEFATESVSEVPSTQVLGPSAYHVMSWYPIFKKHSIKTITIAVPQRFSRYLHEDGIMLPNDIVEDAIGDDMLSDDDEAFPATGDKVAGDDHRHPEPFHDLNKEIIRAIEDLGGKVFVKFNDKAPLDAAWINSGSLMCDSLPSVYLLLKASDRVSEAVREADNHIILRKWANMHPSMEFRCFVNSSVLRGIFAIFSSLLHCLL
jgi:hypothetical protein